MFINHTEILITTTNAGAYALTQKDDIYTLQHARPGEEFKTTSTYTDEVALIIQIKKIAPLKSWVRRPNNHVPFE